MSLDEWRTQIDDLDRRLLRLLGQRAELSVAIGRAKREAGQPVFVPERERVLVDDLVRLTPSPLQTDAVRAIWGEILSSSRGLQQSFHVAHFGPTATFTHQAALHHFGASVSYRPTRAIPEVFSLVERGDVDVGVVPVENSTEGAVNHTLDCLVDSELLVSGEIRLEIHHCLLSRARELAEVKRVYSHPQPIGQCREWLDRNLPHAETVETTTTANAAERVAEDATAAAIASDLASRVYGVPILRERIEDVPHNVTRFFVLGQHPVGPTGRDKTSLAVSIRDEVGTLHRILEPFAVARLNLTKIESRPTRRRPWEYVFFVDFEGHQTDPVTRGGLAAVRERCLFLTVLGSYPAAA